MPVTRMLLLAAELGVFYISLFLSYYTPRPLRFIYFLAVTATFASIARYVPFEISKANDYAFGILGSLWVLRSIEYFIINDPHKQYWWVGMESDTKKSDDAQRSVQYQQLSLKDKLSWTLNHTLCSRGIGWNWCIPHTPPGFPAGTPKTTFFGKTILHCLWMYFLQDIGRTYLSLLPYITTDGREGTPVRDLVGVERAVTVFMLGLMTFIQTDISYNFLCMFGVGTGLYWSRVQDVIPVYGRWRECYTLRRFWGRVWHQNCRKPLQTIGRFIAFDIFRAERGSLLSNYTQVYTSFILSGAFHWVAAKSMQPQWTFYNTCTFFIWQAHAFVIEDFAIWVGKKFGLSSPRWRYLGLIWVMGFFIWCAPWYFDDCTEGGWLRPETFPVSVIRGVWKGEWATQTV